MLELNQPEAGATTANGESVMDVPWVCRDEKLRKVLDEPFARVNLVVFAGGFAKDKAKLKEVKKLNNAEKLRSSILGLAFSEADKKTLCGETLSNMQDVQVFGVRGVGSQQGLPSWGVGALWATAVPSSNRAVLACRLEDARSAASSGSKEFVSFPSVVSYVRSMSQEEMDKKPFQMHYATLTEGTDGSRKLKVYVYSLSVSLSLHFLGPNTQA